MLPFNAAIRHPRQQKEEVFFFEKKNQKLLRLRPHQRPR